MSDRAGRLVRLLPPSWRGGSVAALRRRHRARRILAAVLVALAALAVVGQLSAAGARVSVLVAARDLPAGHRLSAADLRTIPWPSAPGVPRLGTDQTVGQVLDAALAAGDPVTASRLRPARSWPGSDRRVVLSVPLDPVLARVVRPGDRVDVFGAGRLLTAGAIVSAAIDDGDADSWTGAGQDPRVLLAVTPGDAPAVGTAVQNADGSVSLALHPAA